MALTKYRNGLSPKIIAEVGKGEVLNVFMERLITLIRNIDKANESSINSNRGRTIVQEL